MGGGGGGGGAGRCQTFFFFFFPVQQTTSGIGHRVKYFFRVGNQYAECETQGYYHRGTRLNAIKRFCICSL